MILDDDMKDYDLQEVDHSKLQLEAAIFISIGFIVMGLVALFLLVFCGLDIIDVLLCLGVSFFASFNTLSKIYFKSRK